MMPAFFAHFKAASDVRSKLKWINSTLSLVAIFLLNDSTNCGAEERQGGHQLAE